MDMARPCAQNGSPLTSTHCTHLGSRRETKAGWTTRNMEKNSGKGDQGQRVKVMGRGGNSSEGAAPGSPRMLLNILESCSTLV